MPEFSPNEIHNREHIAPDKTGDNIAAKKTANYVWDGANWQRMTQPTGGGTGSTTPTSVLNGKTTVTTAGTRVSLAASTAAASVTIKALASNTGTIYVGNSSVSASNGFQLATGDTVSLDVANLNTVNIDASVSGEGVSYLAVD